MATKADEIRELAEASCYAFARLVGPLRVYGQIHQEALAWLSRSNAALDQLLLLPRGHLKSHLLAVWCAWWITKHPETTILYASATEDLAVAQLSSIKNLLESDTHRRYWPDLIHKEESKRDRWAAKDIKIDHPNRKALGIRDATVAARGIGANTTGLHCDVLVLDDLVVPGNAYTEEGRTSVKAAYSQFASVRNPGGITKVAGTRYHPQDIYSVMLDTRIESFDAGGNVTGEQKVYEVFERPVKDQMGLFLWPREQHPKTKLWYGFGEEVLAKIRATYVASNELAQFYAQYYNDPNDPSSDRVSSDRFQYYDPKHLTWNGQWNYNGEALAVYAAGDLAFTTGDQSDYTAFAVVGVSPRGFVYILALDMFRTSQYEKYYTTVLGLWDKWRFKRCRIETNAGANLVVTYIQDRMREEGKAFIVEGQNAKGKKSERHAIVLEPRYHNNTVWHYRGGYMATYEEQLVLARPSHDDLKDAVSAAVEISKPAAASRFRTTVAPIVTANDRFGGRPR